MNQEYQAAGVLPLADPNNPNGAVLKMDTPTGPAIEAVTDQLMAAEFDGPKYILLVTDGDPDTCAKPDPQCGQDESIAAVQRAYASGIGTFVVGIGDILSTAASGCFSGRCGTDHLQDLANAGQGLPVLHPGEQYGYDCLQGPTSFTGTYEAMTVATAGDASFYAPTSQAELRDTIAELIAGVRTCTYTLSATVDLDKAGSGTVRFRNADGDELLPYGDANGWRLVDETTLEITGDACDRLVDVSQIVQALEISFPCDAAVPR
jgi:hypothetical protein